MDVCWGFLCWVGLEQLLMVDCISLSAKLSGTVTGPIFTGKETSCLLLEMSVRPSLELL